MMGDSPVTVTVSCNVETRIVTSTVTTEPTLTVSSGRVKLANPDSSHCTE